MEYLATSIHQTGHYFPSQWEVGALPKCLYIRYRGGWLGVTIDLGAELGEDIFGRRIGDDYDGEMSTEDMMKHTEGLIDWSRIRDTKGG